MCRLRWLAAVPGLWLAIAGTAALSAEHSFDGVYTGKRVLTRGPGAQCPATEDVSVTIHGATMHFTNSQLKNSVIAFYPKRDGSFGEIYVDEGGDTVTIHGRVNGDIIEADVNNPPCEHHWHLRIETRR
jgi:hypothetical protein